MSSRRNLLLSYLANSYKWLPYSFEDINNSLIPATISGKNVKNKLRFTKLYANGEIINGSYRGTDISEVSSSVGVSIALKYQGNGVINSHDTLERTNTEWVFTKNVQYNFLRNLNWVKYGSNQGVYRTLPIENMSATGISSTNQHYLACLYVEDTNNNVFLGTTECIAKELQRIIISIPSATDVATLLQQFGDKLVYYPIATPQVIRIPRKHLAMVKISDLSWVYSLTTFRFASNISNAKPTANNETLANIYCSPFMTKTYYQTLNENLSIGLDRVSYCYIKDTSISTTADFLSKYGDYYIFYETTDEVEEMPFEIEVESGGTITTDSDVKPNADVLLKCK